MENGAREGSNTLVYRASEIDRIARVAFDITRKRAKWLCSVDKANVRECTELWRETETRVGAVTRMWKRPTRTSTTPYAVGAGAQPVRRDGDHQ